MRRRLVLLANEYPFARGDVAFLEAEIAELAARFDEVVVFNYPAPGPETLAELPPGVRYGGSVKGGNRRRVLLDLLVPAVALLFVRALLAERRAGRMNGRWRTEVVAALASVKRGRTPALRRLLREPGWSTTVYAYWAAGAGLAVATLPRTAGPVVLRLHRYDLYEDQQAAGQPLRASLFRRADVLLAISEHGRRYLAEQYPGIVDPATVVLSRLGTLDHGTTPERTDGERVVVLSCSSISPVKRVELILDAVHSLSRSRPVRWVHLGGGPLEAAVRERTRALSDERLEADLRGQVRHEDVMDFLRENHVDVFVNASASEGVPVSIMEALSFDVPVVATDVGGSGEIVGEALGSGVLVPAEVTADELARAVERVLDGRGGLAPRAVWSRFSDAAQNARETARLVSTTHPREKRGHRP
jgi:glycosyltransferase involved in cell wall biosynthesis